MAKDTQGVSIRKMRDGEQAHVRSIMRTCFPPFMRLFLSVGGSVYLAEKEGQIIGGTVLKTLNLPQIGKIGIVSWLFTLPGERKQGAAEMLLDRALEHFQDISCRDILAVVEGYNTSSANRFIERGFAQLSALEQLTRYSIGLIPMMLATFHFSDIGHFLWCKSITGPPRKHYSASSAAQGVTTILMHIAYSVFLFRSFSAGIPVLIILAVRTAGFLAGWKATSTAKVRYQMWGTSLLVSWFIALFFGSFFPSPGGWYPKENGWSYRDFRKPFGVSAAAGAWALILLSAVAVFLHSFGVPILSAHASSFKYLMVPLLAFDSIFAFFPFSCFLSRRILDWSIQAFLSTAAAGALMIALLLYCL